MDGYRTKAVGADVTSVPCNGQWMPIGISVDATNGITLSIDRLPGEDAEQLKAWLKPIPVTGETVARLARQGDPLGLQIMTQAGEALGLAVASLAMILDIEFYVFGGSVSKCGDLLLEPARNIMPKYCFKTVSPRIRIITSELGDDAPLLGCGWLARQTLVLSNRGE